MDDSNWELRVSEVSPGMSERYPELFMAFRNSEEEFVRFRKFTYLLLSSWPLSLFFIGTSAYYVVFLLIFFPTSLFVLFYFGLKLRMLRKHSQGLVAVFYKLEDRKDQSIFRKTEEIALKIDDLERSSIEIGSVIINGDNSPVVVGAGTINFVRDIDSLDPELANALTAVVGHIENIKSKDAAEFLEKFREQLESEKPDKTILKSLWDSTVAAAPTIKQMTDVVGNIAKLFV